ncbi:M23/M37 family peptidase [Catenovulum agarivorans DS-2]|uniref:M23/M37 family peptidase n=1 Tax=Catenovulum agarivorans DS-2 TaxID=1328313 RepID=W7QQC5_9ALTE|nr:peptidoglycan DD-metalloendopeptidase family protein [Catenovulum agarivorans]EWH10093.1 M23/M37 family peptidase [Catenovulum agarivorans DS-2]
MRGLTRFWSDFPTLHKVYIGFISLVMVIALWLPLEDASASKQNDSSTTALKPGVRYDLSTLEVVEPTTAPAESEAEPESSDTAAQAPQTEQTSPSAANTHNDVADNNVNSAIEWRSVKIRKNDNLAKIFERNRISAKTLLQVSQSGPAANTLINKMRPGQTIELGFLDDKFDRLMYPLSKFEYIEITSADTGFYAQQVTRAVDTKHAFAAAVIKSNFWKAGVQAGLNDTQIMNLANIFGWDVDFALDIRKGDSFTVVYEELLVEGEHAGYGNILAAEFVNQGDTYAAIRHSDGSYYTPEGNSMRKAFLRAPVNFKYISSSFNPRRLHPVTGRVAPHRGIDYAARTGTPVVAAGDGKVIKSGYNSLNGNYVFIQHGKEYVTKYLHLHKRYVRTGAKVKQNQKIGTVGATGRVTGPHLHYEFLVNGVHRNPKTVKLPKALPIESSEKAEFMAIANNMMSLLQTNKRVLLAAN